MNNNKMNNDKCIVCNGYTGFTGHSSSLRWHGKHYTRPCGKCHRHCKCPKGTHKDDSHTCGALKPNGGWCQKQIYLRTCGKCHEHDKCPVGAHDEDLESNRDANGNNLDEYEESFLDDGEENCDDNSNNNDNCNDLEESMLDEDNNNDDCNDSEEESILGEESMSDEYE